jgi:hypothetical protein
MRAWRHAALLSIFALIPETAQQIQDFAGTWVMRYQSWNVLILKLPADDGHITGSLQDPKEFGLDWSGNLTSIEPGQSIHGVQQATWKSGQLELTTDDDRYVMTPLPPSM